MHPNIADVQVKHEQYRDLIREADHQRLASTFGSTAKPQMTMIIADVSVRARQLACRFGPLRASSMCAMPVRS